MLKLTKIWFLCAVLALFSTSASAIGIRICITLGDRNDNCKNGGICEIRLGRCNQSAPIAQQSSGSATLEGTVLVVDVTTIPEQVRTQWTIVNSNETVNADVAAALGYKSVRILPGTYKTVKTSGGYSTSFKVQLGEKIIVRK